MAPSDAIDAQLKARLLANLGSRAIVFVGLMGAGKTSVGRRVAQMLGLDFMDSDHEIETVSRMSVPELFKVYGEPEFRALEQRVVLRLVTEGPCLLATGGGAFMNAETRAAIRDHGVSVWLNADLDTLMERVAKRRNRPLLQAPDPRGVMQNLMNERYPIYGEADIAVMSRDARHGVIAAEIVKSLDDFLASPAVDRKMKDQIA